MARTTVLATGFTAATSSDIVVAQGQSATVSIYQDATGDYPFGVKLTVNQATPGIDNFITLLDGIGKQTLLAGPGTYRVVRPLYAGTPLGVFVES